MRTSLRHGASEQPDPLLFKPRLRQDVVIRRLESRRDGCYYMMKSPRAGTYLRLSAREHALVSLMDGSRTVSEIIVEAFFQYQSLAFAQVTELVKLLHDQSFLVTTPASSDLLVGHDLRTQDPPRKRLRRTFERLLRSEILFPGIDAFVTRLWGSVGWLLLAWPTIALFGLVAVGGLLMLLVSDHLAEIKPVNLFAARSVSTALVMVLFVPLLIFAHEMAHALVCKSFGREVRRGGVALYFGIPVFFVDTTDIWLEDRWRRIAVSAAGPVSDLVMAGACSLLVLALPAQAAPTALFLASIAYFIFLCNLVPLLELDGYYVLIDLLEVPRLRARSFAFVRGTLIGKLRRWERFSHEELLFTLYGVLAGVFSVLMFFYAAHLLEMQLAGLVGAIAEDGSWFLVPIVVLLVVVVGAPLLLRAVGAIHHVVRLAAHGFRALGRSSRGGA